MCKKSYNLTRFLKYIRLNLNVNVEFYCCASAGTTSPLVKIIFPYFAVSLKGVEKFIYSKIDENDFKNK
jgi:hypothetical protein